MLEYRYGLGDVQLETHTTPLSNARGVEHALTHVLKYVYGSVKLQLTKHVLLSNIG